MDDDYSSTDSSSDSSTTIPAATAGIVMLSLPDSFDEDAAEDKSSADQDVFETPPESSLVGTSQEKTPLLDLDQIGDDNYRDFEGVGDIGDGSGVIVVVGGCGEEGDGAVDLGRDADLVTSEAESVEFRVSKRDLSMEGSSEESLPPSKKLRVSEQESGKSEEELETERLSLSNLGSDSDQTLEIAGDDAKSVEESSGKKNAEYSDSESENATEETQPVTEESGSPSGVEYSYQEGIEIDSGVLRVLPLSFCPPADSSERHAEEGHSWSSLLETLKRVREITRQDCKNKVDKCSFLEIAKRRGMTFPQL
ncbi:uncharacterized protein LOC112177611 [Rosa chinensis]|uniref:uncharacterized protein LOC112177611 n=1 Tax=Rosa chinensis TaxID=74649 RepID=UPI000D093765|nr:uncharacterized protein LOC112177611 [Rosa chinensis]